MGDKKSDFETLWKGKWVSVVSPKKNPYECLHENNMVFVVPILNEKIGIRYELCPSYQIKAEGDENEKFYTVISGCIEEGESPKEAALRELKEEAGIEYEDGKVYIIFENVPYVKNTDARVTLIFIQLTKYKEGIAEGDGTEYEKRSEVVWVSVQELTEIIQKHEQGTDFLLYTIFNMVMSWLVAQKMDATIQVPKETSTKDDADKKTGGYVLHKVAKLENNLYQIDSSDMPIDIVSVREIIKSVGGMNDVTASQWLDELDEKNNHIFKEADATTIIKMYEVEASVEEDNVQVADDNLVSQTVVPNTPVNKVTINTNVRKVAAENLDLNGTLKDSRQRASWLKILR